MVARLSCTSRHPRHPETFVAYFRFMKSHRSGYTVQVAGRQVVVRTGTKQQSINVCTTEARAGRYQISYYLPARSAVAKDELAFLGVEDLEELLAWLEDRSGTEGTTGGAPSTPVPLIELSDTSAVWLQEAVAATERAIERLLEEFVEKPYLHRVEHSLHTRLHALLLEEPDLRKEVSIGTSGHLTQLVHKEWPETIPAPGQIHQHRGLFDLAVLAPEQLGAANLEQFRRGRIAAPIVVEVGLDYGYKHLSDDAEKLTNSKVRAPYLVHLSRVGIVDANATEALLCAPPSPVRAAYAHLSGGKANVKHLHESVVTVTANPEPS